MSSARRIRCVCEVCGCEGFVFRDPATGRVVSAALAALIGGLLDACPVCARRCENEFCEAMRKKIEHDRYLPGDSVVDAR